MRDHTSLTFIPCESGATPRRIGPENRKKIRSQVMRTLWSKKKTRSSKKSPQWQLTVLVDKQHRNQLGNGLRCCNDYISGGVISEYDHARCLQPIAYLSNISPILDSDNNLQNDQVGLRPSVTPSPGPLSSSPDILPLENPYKTLRVWKRTCNQHKMKNREHPSRDVVDNFNDRYVDFDHDKDGEEKQARDWINSDFLNLPTSSPSCCGVDPFASSVAPINLRMHSYLQYYLENIVPVLHPVAEQTSLLKQNLTSQLNRSPLILYSTLCIAALGVDNYCNKYDELLLFLRWTDSELPVPHSFQFKTQTLHLLLHAMQDPKSSTHDIVFALICLITYDLLVDNYKEVRAHLAGLHQLLQSHGDLQNILRSETCTPGTMAEMRKVVHEMEKYAEYCGDDSNIRTLAPTPDETALCRRLAAYSRFPTLIGKSQVIPDGVDWFAVENESAGSWMRWLLRNVSGTWAAEMTRA